MKHYFIALFAFLTIATTGSALSFDEARHEALYLTDKMAYELMLSSEQMEAVYEINLDYLLNVNRGSDLYGIFWERRNIDLQYVLSPYQYEIYLSANYFYRPLNWIRGAWKLAIYGRYADPHLFYYSRPRAWVSFRGGRNVGTRSFYMGRNYYAPQRGARPDRGHAPNVYQRRGNHPGQGYRPQGNGQRPNPDYRPQGNGQRPNPDYRPQGNQSRPAQPGQPVRRGQSGQSGQFGQPSNSGNSAQPAQPDPSSGGRRVFRR